MIFLVLIDCGWPDGSHPTIPLILDQMIRACDRAFDSFASLDWLQILLGA